jgi:glycosyltransferase involved in cell wall biosynthesis
MWETAGLVVLEAQAAGCRVITSASGALPEITGGHADLLPPPSPGRVDSTAFARTAAALLDQQQQDPDAVRSSLAAARTWTRRFGDWANRAEQLERLIQAG